MKKNIETVKEIKIKDDIIKKLNEENANLKNLVWVTAHYHGGVLEMSRDYMNMAESLNSFIRIKNDHPDVIRVYSKVRPDKPKTD